MSFGIWSISLNTGSGKTLSVFLIFRAGEYSASAIKSASVSLNTLIGCPGYLRWANVSTILTLLWIIKFVLAGSGTICCNRGRNKVNNRPAPQEPKTKPPLAATTTTITSMKSTRIAQSIATVNSRVCSQFHAATRRQCQSCGLDCGHVSDSISDTKVAEDKT